MGDWVFHPGRTPPPPGVKVLAVEKDYYGVDEFFMAKVDRRGIWSNDEGVTCEPRCWTFCPTMPSADEVFEDYVPSAAST